MKKSLQFIGLKFENFIQTKLKTMTWINSRTRCYKTLFLVVLVTIIYCFSTDRLYSFEYNNLVEINQNRYADTTYAEMVFLNKVVDFGNVVQDTVLNATYFFKNSGNEVLYIYSVKPDCTCTDFKISKNEIMPGDSANICLVLNTESKYGKQKIYAIVHANTKVKFYKLTLKVNVNLPQQ